MSEQVSDFLTHYGVPGMKWGRRKGGEATSSSRVKVSKEDKIAGKKNFKLYTDPVIEKRVHQWFNNDISAKRYSELSTKDVHFKIGKEFVRVSPRKDEKLRDLTFVSYLKEDRVRYRAVMPNTGFQSFRKNYEYSYQATKALSSPSEKVRVDAFIELIATPSIKVGKKTLTGREILERQGYGREIKTMSSQQVGLKFYNEHTAMMIRPTVVNKAYFELLKSKGYNALLDDNDRGIVSKAPLIILDPNGSIKKMSVRQLSKQDIVDAKKTITIVK